MGREALCAHCKQYSLECTFFLPITETRFKKKKQVGKSLLIISRPEGADGTEEPAPESRAITRSPGRPQEVPARLEGSSTQNFKMKYRILTFSRSYITLIPPPHRPSRKYIRSIRSQEPQ